MKSGFSKEILCLFFIICSSIMFGNVLIEIKAAVNDRVESISSHVEHLEYHVSSYKPNKKIEGLDEITVIRNVDELKTFKEGLLEKKLNISWLNTKLDNYSEEEYYKTNTIIVLCLDNKGRVIANRVTDVIKDESDVTIEVEKRVLESEADYSWIAVVDILDIDSDISIKIKKS